MILAVPPTLFSPSGPSSRGISDHAEFVCQEAEKGLHHLQKSYALGFGGKGTFHELVEVYQDKSQPNWDGYGAAPVTPEAFLHAFRFLEALPLGSPAPSVGAEPDGNITFEWYQSPRRVLSVSVDPDGEMNYAALLPGPRKIRGTEQFVSTIPSEILRLIDEIIPSNDGAFAEPLAA